jgi:hypothetical protein
MLSGALCLNCVWLHAASCQCTDDARIDALWRPGVRSACLSWSRRTPNGATGERQSQGFSPQRHEGTKEHKGRARVFSLSPCLPVSSSPRLSFRSDSRRDTCTTKELDTCTTIGGTDTCTTQGRGAQGLTGFFPDSSALTCLGWAALTQVLRANRESAPVGLASAAGAAECSSWRARDLPDTAWPRKCPLIVKTSGPPGTHIMAHICPLVKPFHDFLSTFFAARPNPTKIKGTPTGIPAAPTPQPQCPSSYSVQSAIFRSAMLPKSRSFRDNNKASFTRAIAAIFRSLELNRRWRPRNRSNC